MTPDSPNSEITSESWLSLQEASELLGVAASTLRRWGDLGRVPMKKTLGGHRRFPRTAVMHLVHSPTHEIPIAAPQQPSAQRWGVDAHELARQGWHTRLAAQLDSTKMRSLGQRLLGLLIQYINQHEDDQRFLDQARTVGVDYGHEARHAGISMHDTVEAFLFFRSSFAQLVTPLPGIVQSTEPVDALALQRRINQFMDAILLSVITGYESSES